MDTKVSIRETNCVVAVMDSPAWMFMPAMGMKDVMYSIPNPSSNAVMDVRKYSAITFNPILPSEERLPKEDTLVAMEKNTPGPMMMFNAAR